jgi:SAM-dependent methyltransferase
MTFGSLKQLLKRILPAALARRAAGLYRRAVLFRYSGDTARAKAEMELAFWRGTLRPGVNVENRYYEYLFTTLFGLETQLYQGRRILDVGCGPRGSLEWASMADQRIGLDPLADAYRAFGTARHAMTYIKAGSETIPFLTGAFDIVSSFNSLDHVDNLDLSVKELARVLAPSGYLLLIVEVNHEPTLTEPIMLSWDIPARFAPSLQVVRAQCLEKPVGPIYRSIQKGVPFDFNKPTSRPGILCALLRKCEP